MFDAMKPQAGRVSKEKVRNVLMQISELSDTILDKIWELSDQDKDGFLDRSEFSVVYHLIWRACVGDEIPDVIYISVQRCHI